MTLPDPETVERCLRDAGSVTEAAECHGMLCGLICGGSSQPLSAWTAGLFPENRPEPPPEELASLYAATVRQLDDDEFAFELLLPGDSASLEQRALALADWSAGFVFGAGSAADASRPVSSESAEFLADAAEIARVATDVSADDEEEGAYTELVEYLRVGALLLRTENRPR